jgi:hypothetical protein
MTTAPIRKLVPKKPPAKRLFSGMAGSPLAQVNEPAPAPAPEIVVEPVQVTVITMDPPTALSDASTPAGTAQATVDRLMEAVDASKTNEQVKQALHILSSPKSASAIRGKKWREEQKQKNPQFIQQEAQRKTAERAEIDRVQQIEDTLRSNPDSPFTFMVGGKPLKTGGYDSQKIEAVIAKAEEARTGRRVVRKGFGSHKIEKTPANELPQEFEDSFAPKFKNSGEVHLLHQFIYENTRKSPMLVCVLCKEQIATGKGDDLGDNIVAGYDHFKNTHPEQFQGFLARLKGSGCTEDHEGMVRRHGGGINKVQCGRCRKILWKPPKNAPEPRSDRPAKAAA